MFSMMFASGGRRRLLPVTANLLAQYDASRTDLVTLASHEIAPAQGSITVPMISADSSRVAGGMTTGTSANGRQTLNCGTSYGWTAKTPTTTTYSNHTFIIISRMYSQTYPVTFAPAGVGFTLWDAGIEIDSAGGAGANRMDYALGFGNDRTASLTNIANADGNVRVLGWSCSGGSVSTAIACTSVAGTITYGTTGTPGSYSPCFFGSGTSYFGNPTNTFGAAGNYDVCELLLYSAALSQPDLDAIAAYAVTKWGAATT